jgi:hypothetical protein
MQPSVGRALPRSAMQAEDCSDSYIFGIAGLHDFVLTRLSELELSIGSPHLQYVDLSVE